MVDKEIPFDGIDSLVNLSFLGINLRGRASAVPSGRISYKGDASLDIITKYTLRKSLILSDYSSKTTVPVDITISAINDTVCSIYGSISTDVFHLLNDTFKAKYGEPSFYSGTESITSKWKFRNQEISLYREKPQRVIWHSELKKNIYTNFYDFKGIHISYSDYALCERLDSLNAIQIAFAKSQKHIEDSLAEINRAAAARQAQQELEKRRLEDAKQL